LIDGAMGEGGGQVLRTSFAISSLKHESLRVVNIRRGRPRPGLARQHLTGIETLCRITNGKLEGAHIGSQEVTFFPGEQSGGSFTVDIGTAGSISLVLQTLVLPSLFALDTTSLKLRGGTDVNWSPPVDFLGSVLFPLLSKMGVNVSTKLVRRGYYPKGGGEVTSEISPISSLEPFPMLRRSGNVKVFGIAHSENLPEHVVDRMKGAATVHLSKEGLDDIEISRDVKKGGPGVGTGISLWACDGDSLFGRSCIGERGKPAEKVGESAAARLVDELSSNATVDVHTSDQILPFIALGGGSFKVREVSSHAETNMAVLEKLLGCTFNAEPTDDGCVQITSEDGRR